MPLFHMLLIVMSTMCTLDFIAVHICHARAVFFARKVSALLRIRQFLPESAFLLFVLALLTMSIDLPLAARANLTI